MSLLPDQCGEKPHLSLLKIRASMWQKNGCNRYCVKNRQIYFIKANKNCLIILHDLQQ